MKERTADFLPGDMLAYRSQLDLKSPKRDALMSQNNDSDIKYKLFSVNYALI